MTTLTIADLTMTPLKRNAMAAVHGGNAGPRMLLPALPAYPPPESEPTVSSDGRIIAFLSNGWSNSRDDEVLTYDLGRGSLDRLP